MLSDAYKLTCASADGLLTTSLSAQLDGGALHSLMLFDNNSTEPMVGPVLCVYGLLIKLSIFCLPFVSLSQFSLL
jgi:hypothetical protein